MLVEWKRIEKRWVVCKIWHFVFLEKEDKNRRRIKGLPHGVEDQNKLKKTTKTLRS